MMRLTILFFLWVCLLTKSYTQTPLSHLVKPYLQFSTQNSIYVLWETNQLSEGIVYYGEALLNSKEPNLNKFKSSTSKKQLHEILLDELKPETNYFWKAASIGENKDTLYSDVYTFKTGVLPTSAFMFALIGDTQRNSDTPWAWGKIADLVWKDRPNFVIHVGDVVDKGLAKDNWTDHFFPYGHVLMSRVCIYPVLGNHEQDSPLYYDYIVAPQPEYYYTFTYGNVQFFMIDSNRDVKEGSEQYDWLEWELSKSTAKWKIVAHHHPPYTSDNDDYGDTKKGLSLQGSSTRNLVPLYEKYGVDFCVYGHTHLYERTWPILNNRVNVKDGVVYINSGGAGGFIEDFAPSRSWFTTELQAIHHYCTFNIFENRLIFKAIDHEGRLIDLFEMTKEKEMKLVTSPPAVRFNYDATLFEKEAKISLSSLTPNAAIYYTLDGSTPSMKSKKFEGGELTIQNSCELKAIAFNPTGESSRVKTILFTKGKAMPSLNKKFTKNGVRYSYFEGSWEKLPDFKSLSTIKKGVKNKIDLSELGHREDQFAVSFSSHILVEKKGLHQFYLKSDDGSKLYINDQLVVDHDGQHSAMTMNGQILLEAGYHKIEIHYMESRGSEYLQAGWVKSDGQKIPFSPFELWTE